MSADQRDNSHDSLAAALLNFAETKGVDNPRGPQTKLTPGQQALLEFKLRGAFTSLCEAIDYGASPDEIIGNQRRLHALRNGHVSPHFQQMGRLRLGLAALGGQVHSFAKATGEMISPLTEEEYQELK